ncbi:photosystem II protein Psb27 [Cylindrospermopsis raciborskii]|uniref:Photosystem II lipoprotein Psb27 n=1 Tax=Cylindrospermopsis raciborskii CENA302 TaxID=1170768 RepID=A0A9Q5WAZ6_9CYAN|nr:photosystem II protein Psb27 [Cylindrospermopsis raciborskii]MCZ2200942.1 photosystem II protein Psb27 [Cylindrospermopsis raciborskii PAMP2012]MCZ2206521.1 photosystem II protein Psb27 [Cylindrospermopsis raciborskii PAMP2011]OPH10960.1 photosystem II protein Psb27 [Cylindrospermopsis raciborskii CENA302]
MKSYWSPLLALILAITIGLMGCSGTPDSLTGDYRQDTLSVVKVMRQAVEVSPDDPNKAAIQAEARQKINDFSARYQRSSSVSTLSSFTTIRTALNTLAGHYSSYPNRPLPQKLKDRLELELNRVELSLKRGY